MSAKKTTKRRPLPGPGSLYWDLHNPRPPRITEIAFTAMGRPEALVQALRVHLREVAVELPPGQTELVLQASIAHPGAGRSKRKAQKRRAQRRSKP